MVSTVNAREGDEETQPMNFGKEIALLKGLTVKGLQAKYSEVFGEATRSHHKAFLVKRIAWRIQSRAEGGLSERARARAAELGADADIRLPRAWDTFLIPKAPWASIKIAIIEYFACTLFPGC